MWRADFRQNNQIQQILPDHFVQYAENKISRKYLHFPIDKRLNLCYNKYTKREREVNKNGKSKNGMFRYGRHYR